MNTFKLTVIQVTRLEVKVEAESESKAKETWVQGQLLTSVPVETQVVDVQRLVA